MMLERYDAVSESSSSRTRARKLIPTERLTMSLYRLFAASESARGRTAERRHVDSTANVFERSNDCATARPSDALAQQVRGAREAVLAVAQRAPRDARQVQEHATQGQLGPGSDRSHGTHGARRQGEEFGTGRHDQGEGSSETRARQDEVGASYLPRHPSLVLSVYSGNVVDTIRVERDDRARKTKSNASNATSVSPKNVSKTPRGRRAQKCRA